MCCLAGIVVSAAVVVPVLSVENGFAAVEQRKRMCAADSVEPAIAVGERIVWAVLNC